jgi:DNA-binding beta-propeller fold protein YncE
MDRSISRRTNPSWSGFRRLVVVAGLGVATTMSIAPVQATLCGGVDYPFPYTDVSAVGAAFCPGIMEAYVTGVSKGTSPTTFSPNETVTRVQMTTFLQRSLDQGLTRASRRAALNQWWTPQNTNAMQMIYLGGPQWCAADGENIWITNSMQIIELQASSGKVIGLWSEAFASAGILVAAGKVFVTGDGNPGSLYVIDPTHPLFAVTVADSLLGGGTTGITFDGTHLWTANTFGSVSIITPQATTPYPATTVKTGFASPYGILYDGAHIWVTDFTAGTLLKLDPSGTTLQTVTVGAGPQAPGFDGTNIWVPNSGSNSITVVQASTGTVVDTIAATASNLLNGPSAATFDGERVLVTNAAGNTVSMFKAADLSFIANVATGSATTPLGACSDGINFWVPLPGTGNMLRF